MVYGENMIMKQIYEYNNEGKPIEEKTTQSIYCPSVGKVVGYPRASPVELIVIENICATPDIGECYIQVRIGTTSLFLNPDGEPSEGVPATLIPYPEHKGRFNYCLKLIPLYILPKQCWDILLYNKKPIKSGENVKVVVETTVYDGPDSILAVKLLSDATDINVENINLLKRKLMGIQEPKNTEIKKQHLMRKIWKR